MGKVTAKLLHNLCLKGVISVKTFCNYRELFRKAKPTVRYTRNQFRIQRFTEEECQLYFRFTKAEINILMKSLKIRHVYWLRNGTKFTGVEGICILLRRLAYPIRLHDMVSMFCRDESTIASIFHFMLAKVYPTAFEKLSSLEQPYLTKAKMEELAENCTSSGCPYPNVIGFIDGTARRICWPTYNQKTMYSGYKKCHVVKYQSIVLSNGLVGRLDGPFAGRRHDAAIVHLSGILDEMKQVLVNPDGTWYAVYGDSGYSNQKFIKVGYRNHIRLNQQQLEFNATMSTLRVSVEYGFGKISEQFAYLNYFNNQKIYSAPIRKMYYVAAFLVNIQICMRQRSQVADIFGSVIPRLSEYLKE